MAKANINIAASRKDNFRPVRIFYMNFAFILGFDCIHTQYKTLDFTIVILLQKDWILYKSNKLKKQYSSKTKKKSIL
jgi:hypothetical protein